LREAGLPLALVTNTISRTRPRSRRRCPRRALRSLSLTFCPLRSSRLPIWPRIIRVPGACCSTAGRS